MAFVSDIEARLRADNSDFKAKFADADRTVQTFGKKFGTLGNMLGGTLGPLGSFATKFGVIGVAITSAVAGAKKFVEHINEAEYGQNKNVDAAKRMLSVGGAMLEVTKDIGRTFLDIGADIAGIGFRMIEWIGHKAAILDYSREEIDLAERISREAEENIARLEKMKAIQIEVNRIKGQIADIDQKAAEAREKELGIAMQIENAAAKLLVIHDELSRGNLDKIETAKAQLEYAKQLAELEKLYATQKKQNADDEKKRSEELGKAEQERVKAAAEAEKKAAADRESSAREHIDTMDELARLKFESLTADEKIASLARDEQSIKQAILKAEKDGADVAKLQVSLMQTQNELAGLRQDEAMATASTLEEQLESLQAQGVSENQLIAVLVGRGAKESDVLSLLKRQTAELQAQANFVLTINRIGAAYESQSSSALEGIRSRIKAQLDQVRMENAIAPHSQRNPMEIALRSELDQLNREINARENIGAYANKYGEDATRNQYGDALTDRALRAMQDEQTKTRVTLEQILERIRKSPVMGG